MTLSAMGDADTPAGGSVCIRYVQHMLARALTQDPVVVLEHEKVCDMKGQETYWGRVL